MVCLKPISTGQGRNADIEMAKNMMVGRFRKPNIGGIFAIRSGMFCPLKSASRASNSSMKAKIRSGGIINSMRGCKNRNGEKH